MFYPPKKEQSTYEEVPLIKWNFFFNIHESPLRGTSCILKSLMKDMRLNQTGW